MEKRNGREMFLSRQPEEKGAVECQTLARGDLNLLQHRFLPVLVLSTPGVQPAPLSPTLSQLKMSQYQQQKIPAVHEQYLMSRLNR